MDKLYQFKHYSFSNDRLTEQNTTYAAFPIRRQKLHWLAFAPSLFKVSDMMKLLKAFTPGKTVQWIKIQVQWINKKC